jgi:hypothetical protein
MLLSKMTFGADHLRVKVYALTECEPSGPIGRPLHVI